MHSGSHNNKGFDDFAKSAIWNTDDGAFLDCIVRVQDFLYVYWVDVGSATNDQILLPPDDIKEAVSADPDSIRLEICFVPGAGLLQKGESFQPGNDFESDTARAG